MASSKRYAVNTVAAVDSKMGIGYKGGMSWPLIKTHFEFMHRITTETKTEGMQNAVVFGRKTWESIVKYAGKWDKRLNVVLTSKPASEILPGADLVCASLDDALSKMQSPPLCDQIENVFILGGVQLYKEAMEHEQCGLLHMTELNGEFPSDTFHPPIDPSIFKPVQSDVVPQGEYTENGVTYKFTVYKKQGQE